MILFDVDTARDLLEAIRIYEGRLHGTGRRLSPGLRELAALAERSARCRTDQPGHEQVDRADNQSVNQLLTFRDVADTLQTSDSTVKRLVVDGLLASVHIGRSARVRPADLQTYIDGLATTSAERLEAS